jgi:uncharacterized OsmC-like protein
MEVDMDAPVTTIEMPARKAPPAPRNGVDTPKLFATIGAVASQPTLAQFRFRAQNHWVGGTQSRTTIAGFYGVGAEMQHDAPFQASADHPTVLCGEDNAPAPVEWVLHALAACLSAGIANISAARGVTLHSVECSVEGDIDLQGILGLSDKVRNGFQAIRVNYTVKGDAPEEKLRQIVDQARARSAVFDILTGHVPVTIEVDV